MESRQQKGVGVNLSSTDSSATEAVKPGEHKNMAKLRQCVICGFLEGGLTALKPCSSKTHRYKDIDTTILASALGSAGGRPPTYATDEERQAARRETFRRANEKKRRKKGDEPIAA